MAKAVASESAPMETPPVPRAVRPVTPDTVAVVVDSKRGVTAATASDPDAESPAETAKAVEL